MAQMVDPHIGLLSYQEALRNCLIAPTAGAIHSDIMVLMDDAEGTSRLTYALIDNDTVKATVVYVPAQPLNGVRCFDVGYAVAKPFRRQGIATQLLEKSIEEMRQGFGRHMEKFYIEALVGMDNIGSQKVAAKVLSPKSPPRESIDSVSGLPALVYTRLIEC